MGTRDEFKPSTPAPPAMQAVAQAAFNQPVPDSPVSGESETTLLPSLADIPEEIPAPVPSTPPTVAELASSVRQHFPLIQQAAAARVVAAGETLAASGAFDHKVEGYSVSQPLDFYRNYRQGVGLKRDTYWGGKTFAGYRLGRGNFEPWYQERQTNEGGEFEAGFIVPLAQNREIDANRAELWRSQLEQGRVEPEIRAIFIGSIRDATVAYWQWVAAAADYRIAEQVLQLGLDRTSFLERQVEVGEKGEIELVDNQRIIVSRRAKSIDARRKLEQASIKLSLFLRDNVGAPQVLSNDMATVAFPEPLPPEALGASADVIRAQNNRPELEELQLARRQLNVLLRQACNETQPQVDAGMLVSQDVGEPTSSKRDKSQLKLEASVMLSVPLERRKALGKARQLRGKIAQLSAKSRFAADKIAAEAQATHAALVAAAERAQQTAEGLTLAQRMQNAEKRLYDLGQSTLFNLNLREQQAAEAAVAQIIALYDYYVAQANYAAALGLESVEYLSQEATNGAALDQTLED